MKALILALVLILLFGAGAAAPAPASAAGSDLSGWYSIDRAGDKPFGYHLYVGVFEDKDFCKTVVKDRAECVHLTIIEGSGALVGRYT